MLTAQIRPFRFALVAFAPVRLSVLNCKKTSADRSGSLFAIIDERVSPICEARLKSRGFTVIKLPRDERLGAAVASHTDMLLFRDGNTVIASKEYINANENIKSALLSAFPSLDLRLSDEALSKKYPSDAIFNAKIVGKKLYAKSDSVSKEIVRYAKEKGYGTISLNQGYPACTTLFADDGFAITADEGMRRALTLSGIEVLFIENSEKIKLPPYKYGFIGGTAGVFKNTVYFIGNLDAHPNAKEIKKALTKRGFLSVSLDESADSLFDLGGIIFTESGNSDR